MEFYKRAGAVCAKIVILSNMNLQMIHVAGWIFATMHVVVLAK